MGMDPGWAGSSNDILFYNSFKMKAAVILGIIHMTLGIFIKGANALYFNRKLDFYHEFIPQLVLLLALFGFMDVLIINKWLTDWNGNESKAPSIVNVMIEMCLNGGEIKDPDNELPVLTHQMFWSQLMLNLAIIMPIWMLLVKPFMLKKAAEEKETHREAVGGDFEMDVL
mmetsp:Transcript_25717/g.39549  ORF Transcript_25717/g.39549 Transcript_25717/m.39549 type:complete len:170 (-) Transcript_25717:66-575(-)